MAETSEEEMNNIEKPSSFRENDVKDYKVSLTNILPFCDQLEKFIKYIGGIRDLNYYTYEYPTTLQNRLDGNVRELESMLGEVRKAFVTIKQLKMQRKLIKREKANTKKILKKVRDDEIREMERVISLHDEAMFSRWESVKSTQNPDDLEGLLSEIKGKQLALENLSVLTARKLALLQAFLPSAETNVESDSKVKEGTAIPLPFPSFCVTTTDVSSSRIPPPPPMPSVPLSLPTPVSHFPKRNHTQRSSTLRRRRYERREEHSEWNNLVATAGENAPLISLALDDIANSSLINNAYPMILGTNDNSNPDTVSTNSTSDTIIRNMPSPNNSIGNESRNGLENEFQNEMQTVLQALFGDLRAGPALFITESIASNGTADYVENNDRELELYALGRPQQS